MLLLCRGILQALHPWRKRFDLSYPCSLSTCIIPRGKVSCKDPCASWWMLRHQVGQEHAHNPTIAFVDILTHPLDLNLFGLEPLIIPKQRNSIVVMALAVQTLNLITIEFLRI